MEKQKEEKDGSSGDFTRNPAGALSLKLGGAFPIIGWKAFSDPDQVTFQNYQKFKEAGFNIAFLDSRYYKDENMQMLQSQPLLQALQCCERLGIKLQVNIYYPNIPSAENPVLRYPPLKLDLIEDAIEALKSNETVVGWFLKDEPTVREFGWLWAVMDQISDKVDVDQYLYSNLTNNGAGPNSWLAPNYEAYVESYKDCVLPQMLSFDLYCILQNENGQRKLASGYFNNLKYISDQCRKYNLPMWTFILSTAHYKVNIVEVSENETKIEKNPNYPIPTLGELCFQAFCGLAYGSQCIQYFYYGYRDTQSADGKYEDGQWVYHDCPIRKDGSTTKVWDYIKITNGKIQNVRHAFIGMTLKQILHTGTEEDGVAIHDGKLYLEADKLPSPFTRIDNGEAGVLISNFTNQLTRGASAKGLRYLFIVNKDFKKDQSVKVEYDLTSSNIVCDYIGGDITNIDGHSLKLGEPLPDKGIRLVLNAGDACLLCVR